MRILNAHSFLKPSTTLFTSTTYFSLTTWFTSTTDGCAVWLRRLAAPSGCAVWLRRLAARSLGAAGIFFDIKGPWQRGFSAKQVNYAQVHCRS
jgi:hypothetical protein